MEELIIENPLLTTNYIVLFDCFHNKQIEIENQNYEFGIAEVAVYGKILNQVEKIDLFQYFRLHKVKKLVWYGPFSFGFSKSGTNDIKMTGNVMTKEIETLSQSSQ